LRIDKGIFQADLAKMLRVDEMTIVNREKGRTKPGKKYFEWLKGVIPEIGGSSMLKLADYVV
jgi:ribosome-binding protein aMBF1 (putative translation factor)